MVEHLTGACAAGKLALRVRKIFRTLHGRVRGWEIVHPPLVVGGFHQRWNTRRPVHSLWLGELLQCKGLPKFRTEHQH